MIADDIDTTNMFYMYTQYWGGQICFREVCMWCEYLLFATLEYMESNCNIYVLLYSLNKKISRKFMTTHNNIIYGQYAQERTTPPLALNMYMMIMLFYYERYMFMRSMYTELILMD
ncbi:hypothetical protein ACJX0J_015266 [Zea mays]